MKTCSFAARLSLLAVALLASLPTLLYGQKPGKGSKIPMAVGFASSVVDEQDTNTYYNTPEACPNGAIDPLAGLRGDRDKLSTIYNFSFWTPFSVSLTAYIHNTSCNPASNTCLAAVLTNDAKTLSMDTRNTDGPRKATMDFSTPCADCVPAGTANFLGNPITPFWMSVFLTSSFTDMQVCSDRACREAQSPYVNLWFDDPGGDPQVKWQLAWAFVRLLRMDANTWYIIANGCDGSWTATLYKLHRNQKRVHSNYIMPFLLTARIAQ